MNFIPNLQVNFKRARNEIKLKYEVANIHPSLKNAKICESGVNSQTLIPFFSLT